jgi:hypothetical protein
MRMTITIREPAYEQLRDAARADRRPVREHTAYLLERQLERDERREPDRQPAEAAS